jgi:hypothetical protein
MFESTVVIPSPSKFLLMFLKDLPLGPFYLMYLLITFALLSSPRDICWRYNNFPTEISANVYIVLQSDINSLCGWCAANHIKVKTNKSGVVTFTRKNNAISNDYKLCDKCVTRTHSITDLGVLLDVKLFSPPYRLHIFSVTQNVGSAIYLDLFSSATDCSVLLYCTLVTYVTICVACV